MYSTDRDLLFIEFYQKQKHPRQVDAFAGFILKKIMPGDSGYRRRFRYYWY